MKHYSRQCSKCESDISRFHIPSLVALTRRVEIKNTKQKVRYKEEKIYVTIPLCNKCYLAVAKNHYAIFFSIALYLVLLFSLLLSVYQKKSMDNIIPLILFIPIATFIYWGGICLAHLFIENPSPLYIPVSLESFANSNGFTLSGKGREPQIVDPQKEGFMERRDAIKYIRNELHFDAH